MVDECRDAAAQNSRLFLLTTTHGSGEKGESSSRPRISTDQGCTFWDPSGAFFSMRIEGSMLFELGVFYHNFIFHTSIVLYEYSA